MGSQSAGSSVTQANAAGIPIMAFDRKPSGGKGKVKVLGNDGIADALAAVAAGEMYATNAESPFALGQKVMSLAGDVLGGKQVQPDETLRGELVTKNNVKEYADHLTSLGDKSGVPDSLK
ncbi:unnamed protein product [[Actinomadura] parvosata subsp. kistnae]|uniref:Periplasmic binding protein domain-containing protein n=1 Tax=[Actinomadura] parvosata subsp. kistnae TaxID=1909395 RepID=A0A1U9ZZH4_9ACTN|nr:hypothetical protein [Nonomuraea sp. ATCC 55076]AQZ63342.1 hypothetical protein BKM31_19420 [Nonomuraea sp. ATCC 55076]SPL99047.1 unnamed protein product [Actinomadura parvosata subsp. kistnae]